MAYVGGFGGAGAGEAVEGGFSCHGWRLGWDSIFELGCWWVGWGCRCWSSER